MSVAALLLSGCAYRLPPPVPPSQDRVRIVATDPQQYVLRVETETTAVIQVPADDRVTIGVPWHRKSCSVYLFNQIKVGGGGDPLRAGALSSSTPERLSASSLYVSLTSWLPTQQATTFWTCTPE